jgi:hypothetical protein
MLATLLKWHHRLGVLTCIALLLWGLSGVTHPLMSRLQARPATQQVPPQAVDLSLAQPLPGLLRQQHITQLQGASLATVGGRAYYRLSLPTQPSARYLDVLTGQPLADGEQQHAQALARHYTGLREAEAHIVSSERITRFDEDYHPTNRLLPVWRIRFDRPDGLTAYVDVDQDRLATLVDDTRRGMTAWFRLAHDWSFLSGTPTMRLALMSLGLALIGFSAASGLWFAVRMRRSAATRLARKPLARWHRWAGAVLGVSTLTFALSGTAHLWIKQRRDALDQAPVNTALVPVERITQAGWNAITAMPLARLQLLSQGARSAWLAQVAEADGHSGPEAQVGVISQRSEHAEHSGHARPAHEQRVPHTMLHDTHSGEMLSGGIEAWASDLALHFARTPDHTTPAVQDQTWVTRFDDEYGFINKRLPVIRVAIQDQAHTRYYIEPATGTLAAQVDDLDALEGRVFSWLHKWRFTEAGKDIRDIAQVLVVLSTLAMALVGLWLFVQRSSRHNAPAR